MDPFARDGRLSESALRQIAAEAAGTRRHVSGGTENHYTTPGGMVQVPTPAAAQAIPYHYSFLGNSITLTTAAFESYQNTTFTLAVPAGTYWLGCKVIAQLTNGVGGIQLGAALYTQLTTSAGTLLLADETVAVYDPSLATNVTVRGTGFEQDILITSTAATLTLQAFYQGTTNDMQAQILNYSNAGGTSLIALKLS